MGVNALGNAAVIGIRHLVNVIMENGATGFTAVDDSEALKAIAAKMKPKTDRFVPNPASMGA